MFEGFAIIHYADLKALTFVPIGFQSNFGIGCRERYLLFDLAKLIFIEKLGCRTKSGTSQTLIHL